MTLNSSPKLGYACAYAPVPLLDAAGFSPVRVLPQGDFPDQAGRVLHDTLCPHVKKILDRALAGDLDDLSGMVFVNSCDAMRRLSDAFLARGRRATLLDLPVTGGPRSEARFAADMERLYETLCEWSGLSPDPARISAAIKAHNRLAGLLAEASRKRDLGLLSAPRFQELVNFASAHPAEDAAAEAERVLAEPPVAARPGAVPVFLFGNVLPDPEAFALFEDCGARVAGEDFCTGSRFLAPVPEGDDPFARLAAGLLEKPRCARTLDTSSPGGIGADVLARARETGAKGVIAQYLKFCDPYLARMPIVREVLREAGIPFLVLEGDCSLGSIGQQRTRIEAFIEMLR